MSEVKFEINETGRGAFFFEENGKRTGEMVISITGEILIVYHTEVLPELKGTGAAMKLLETMVEYARHNKLKIIPRCPYTLAMFKKDPEKYEDVWYRKE
ncbi:MAG TPA: GNAT family N-acetyltransferase [Chitinophagaceae bacterium]|nr:GNAT family N-acetyltransferase [Chitinophagaceae bacterium]